jgi:hypothetical protein
VADAACDPGATATPLVPRIWLSAHALKLPVAIKAVKAVVCRTILFIPANPDTISQQ